jgi:hypothetical protein
MMLDPSAHLPLHGIQLRRQERKRNATHKRISRYHDDDEEEGKQGGLEDKCIFLGLALLIVNVVCIELMQQLIPRPAYSQN